MSKTRCCIAVVCNLNREFHDQTFPVSPYSYWCWHIVTSLKLCSSAPCQCGSRQQRWITGFSLMDFHQRWLLLCNLHSCWLVFHTLHFFTHTQVIPFTSSFSLCFLHQLEEQTRPHFFFFFFHELGHPPCPSSLTPSALLWQPKVFSSGYRTALAWGGKQSSCIWKDK